MYRSFTNYIQNKILLCESRCVFFLILQTTSSVTLASLKRASALPHMVKRDCDLSRMPEWCCQRHSLTWILEGYINFKYYSICQEHHSQPTRYHHGVYGFPSSWGTQAPWDNYTTDKIPESPQQGLRCGPRSTRCNAEWTALQDKNFHWGSFTMHWILPTSLAVRLGNSSLLSTPHTLLWRSWYPICHCDSSTSQDQCNLFIDFWIPNSSKESHRSTTPWENM